MSNASRWQIQKEIWQGRKFTYMGKTEDGDEVYEISKCSNPTENCRECGRWKKDCEGKEEYEPELDCPSR